MKKKNYNKIRYIKYFERVNYDYNDDDDIIIYSDKKNNDEYLDEYLEGYYDDYCSTCYFECYKCSRLCSYIYNNISCILIEKEIEKKILSYSRPKGIRISLDFQEYSNKIRLINEIKNIIDTNDNERLKRIKYSISKDYLMSHYYNKYLNIEKGCYICRCEICNYPLNIYEHIYQFEKYNRTFIKCIMCEKFKKYIKESFIQISILRKLNTKYNNILKDIKFNKSYYSILDINNNFLIGFKGNIFQNFIKEFKNDNQLYIYNSRLWKRKCKQKHYKKF